LVQGKALGGRHKSDRGGKGAAEQGEGAGQMLKEREQDKAEARDWIETINLFGLVAIRVKQRDPFENFPLRVRERDALRQLPAPDTPQRLSADVIKPLDWQQVPLLDCLLPDAAQPIHHAAFRARMIARQCERRPLAGKPDNLALLAGLDLQAGWSIEVQGLKALRVGWRERPL